LLLLRLLLLAAWLVLSLMRLRLRLPVEGGHSSLGDLCNLGVAPGRVSGLPVSDEKSRRKILQGEVEPRLAQNLVDVLPVQKRGVVATEDGDIGQEELKMCVIKAELVSTGENSRKLSPSAVPFSCHGCEAFLVVHAQQRRGQNKDLEDLVVNFKKESQ
jgi:hypothetical protein